jgi:hypothetical protein
MNKPIGGQGWTNRSIARSPRLSSCDFPSQDQDHHGRQFASVDSAKQAMGAEHDATSPKMS